MTVADKTVIADGVLTPGLMTSSEYEASSQLAHSCKTGCISPLTMQLEVESYDGNNKE